MLKTEVPGANQWWRSLSAAAKVTVVGATALVVAALAWWMYAAYSRPRTLQFPPRAAARDKTIGPSMQSLLSLPLPGTRQRAEAEIAAGLESLLVGFDDINTAQVVVAVPVSPSGTASDSPRLSVQLQLAPSAASAPEWVQNMAAFILHTAPQLQPSDLLIADTSGRILFADGKALTHSTSAPPTSTTETSLPTAAVRMFGPWQQATTLVGGCLLLALAIYGFLRKGLSRPKEPQAPGGALAVDSPTPGPDPFKFLEQLNPQRIIDLVEGERPEVARLTTHYLADEGVAQQVCEELGLARGDSKGPQRPLRDDVLASLATALRAKLATLDTAVDTHLTPAASNPVPGGDENV